MQLCTFKVGISEVCQEEIAPVQVSISKVRALKVGVLKVSTLQEQSFEDPVAQIEFVKVCVFR